MLSTRKVCIHKTAIAPVKKLKCELKAAVKPNGPVVAIAESGFRGDNGLNAEESYCVFSVDVQSANAEPRSRLVAQDFRDVKWCHDLKAERLP